MYLPINIINILLYLLVWSLSTHTYTHNFFLSHSWLLHSSWPLTLKYSMYVFAKNGDSLLRSHNRFQNSIHLSWCNSLTYHPDSSFYQSALYCSFWHSASSTGSCLGPGCALNCHVCLASLDLEHFHSFSLSFVRLAFLKTAVLPLPSAPL